MDVPELRTERLLLRAWRDDDRAPFAALNADPVVMEHHLSTLTRAQSDAAVDRIEAIWRDRGYGVWAVQPVDGPPFVGYVGLAPADFPAPFTPAVEIGWRLAADQWNRGYATEAARAALAHAWTALDVDEVVSFTATTNVRSQRVMQKLGMTRDPADDFEHPNVPVGHSLRRHVLYRVARR